MEVMGNCTRASQGPETGPRRARRARAGFTILELVTAFAVLVVGLLGYLQVIVFTAIAAQSAREQALAAEAARQVMESIKAHTFADVFALYNADPNDDPGGAGTGPGRSFAVPGLAALKNDADGLPGEVDFPTTAANLNVLREDVVDARFGTPRDLNHDGVVDAANHAHDYQLLPVVVRVRWLGKAGPASYQIRTLLVELP